MAVAKVRSFIVIGHYVSMIKAQSVEHEGFRVLVTLEKCIWEDVDS